MIGPFEGKYEFLSNFYNFYKKHGIMISFNGIECETSEHAYQAAKSTTFDDFMYVMNSSTASKSKKRGKEIKKRIDWREAKFKVMYEVCRRKFEIPELKQLLLNTEEEELIELNWWGDEVFGVNSNTMKGENHLGKILMKIRDEFNGKVDENKSTGLGKILFPDE